MFGNTIYGGINDLGVVEKVVLQVQKEDSFYRSRLRDTHNQLVPKMGFAGSYGIIYLRNFA